MIHAIVHHPSSHQTRRTRFVAWLLVLWVVTLAILNPLACFIYCEILHAHDSATHAQPTLFVCDMTHGSATNTLTDAGMLAFPQIPLPVYPGVLVTIAGLVMCLDLQQRITTRVHVLTSYLFLPVSPPPKSLSLR